jgi:hypothetical protein
MDHATIMREAAWCEADEALARALRDMPVLDRELARVNDDRAKGASNLVMQWVRQAARMRHVRRLGSAGDCIEFDPVYHEDFDEEGFVPGEEVLIVKPAIVRGEGEQHVVLLRGEVKRDETAASEIVDGAEAEALAVLTSKSVMAERP